MNTPRLDGLDADIQALIGPWPGPHGGLPPFDRANPAAVEAAYRAALDLKRAELRAIADNPEPPDFHNTLEALEDAGRALRGVQRIFSACATLQATGDMPAVAARLAPLGPALDDAMLHDTALFARVDAVWRARDSTPLDAEQRRLVEVVHAQFLRAGAGLSGADKAQLQAINVRLASLSLQYAQNLIQEAAQQAVFITDEAGLDGLPEAQRQAAAAAADRLGRPGTWAIPNQRPQVWPFLTLSTRRDLREQVWRLWTQRGDNPGPFDNKPLMAETLRLRGQKARLLGHPSAAHATLADRMARTPEAALAMLQRTWAPVLAASRAQIAQWQAIADAEGAGITLAPWDRLHYAEKLRRSRFGLDADAVTAHLPLDKMIDALFWVAGRVHGLHFERIPNAPVLHDSVSAWAVQQHGEPLGVLYLDLFQRPGKAHGSHQSELRSAEHFRGRVLPVSMIVSGLPPAQPGRPVLLPWEYANVLFHEFGHALHMLCNRARYPSLGSLGVAWDFVELPSLLQERWLADRSLLERFARHHATGEAMPTPLLDALEQAQRHDRIFSVNLDYLAPALVDLQMHLAADGGEVDALQIERQVLAAGDMPAAWDQVMRVTHNAHAFAGGYAAGLYSYLWADVMAADVADAFAASPGGLYDEPTANRYRSTVLCAGATVSSDQAFRDFRGRDPDEGALLRRFGLAGAAAETG